mgnify:CR=1 FL=1
MRVMKSPRNVDIEITNRCNLRCKYCAHFSSPGDVDGDLPKEEWFKFFEELNRCAVMDVTLSGGEAFYRKDITEIIESIVHNKMRYSILSNGTLITDEMAKFLAETKRCNSVQVSIDGSAPETHDIFRGKGTFAKAIDSVGYLKKYGISTTVRVTIHKYNVPDLDRVAKLLLEDIGLNDFSTNVASYLGLCRDNNEQIKLSVEDQSIAMETLLRLAKKYNGRVIAAAGPLANARMWLAMEKARLDGEESLPGRGCLAGCGGVTSKLAVRADGVMVPCSQLPHIELGMINKDDLMDVWQNHPELARIRNRKIIPLSEFEFCQGCDYINYCTGNCPALSYTLVGIEDHPSPDACLKRFLEDGGRLPDRSLLD